jgi:3-phosphoshikimate 1-carboxyvinyltransferase
MDKTVSPVSSFSATLTVPPDKSIAHRCGLFALLSEQQSHIKNYSQAADPQTTLKAIQALGAEVRQEGTDVWITGTGRDNIAQEVEKIDCENSGTTMRLLSGILAGSGTKTKLTGDESLTKRPMKRIIDPLTKMGAEISAREETYPPLQFTTNQKLSYITYPLPVASAQVKSCVLLAGLFAGGFTTVIESQTSRDHTERMLRLPVKTNSRGETEIISSRDHVLNPINLTIPGDFSSAAFWIVAALITPGSEITLPNVGINPSRSALLDIVKQMGADIEIEHTEDDPEPTANITVRYSKLSPLKLNPVLVPNCIDELPILSVLFSFVDGTSNFRGAKELRYKESDRITAITEILSAIGADFEEHEDGLTIHGKSGHQFKSAEFESHHDHRIAMSAAVASLRALEPCTIHGAEAAAISYPEFWEHVESLGQD